MLGSLHPQGDSETTLTISECRPGKLGRQWCPGRNYAAGTGNAVTDLIFSIAKRDVTFFSGTEPISFL